MTNKEIPVAFQDFISRSKNYLQFSEDSDSIEGELIGEAVSEEDRVLTETLKKVMDTFDIPSRSKLQAQGALKWKIIVEVYSDEKSGYFDLYNYSQCREPESILELETFEQLREVIVVGLTEPLIHALKAYVRIDNNSNDNNDRFEDIDRTPKVYLGGKVVTTEKMDPSNIAGTTRPSAIVSAQRQKRPLVYDRLARPRVFEQNAVLIPLAHSIFNQSPGFHSPTPESLDLRGSYE